MCPRSSLLESSGETCDQPRFICQLYKALKGFAVDSKPDLATADTCFVLDKLKERGFFKEVRTEKLLTAPIEMVDSTVEKDSDTSGRRAAGPRGGSQLLRGEKRVMK